MANRKNENSSEINHSKYSAQSEAFTTVLRVDAARFFSFSFCRFVLFLLDFRFLFLLNLLLILLPSSFFSVSVCFCFVSFFGNFFTGKIGWKMVDLVSAKWPVNLPKNATQI